MKEFLLNFKNSDAFIFSALLLITFFACFFRLRSFGVYGDDWSAATYLYHTSLTGAIKDWVAWRGEIDNFRPLAIILPFLWFWAYKLARLPGVFGSIAIIYGILYCLTYKILSRFVSPFTAFAATVIFILYPTNNFYLWQVTTTYPLGMICILLAVLFYWRRSFAWCFTLLLCGALINEASLFLFAAALIPQQQISLRTFWISIKSWLLVIGSFVVIYGLARIAAEKFKLVGGSRIGYGLASVSFLQYVMQFFKGVFVVLVSSWGFAGWKILHSFHSIEVFAGMAVAAFFFAVAWILWRRQQENTRPSFAPYWYLLIAGLVLICAGRYYGFYYVPSINVLNLDSRYYFAASFGGVVFCAGIFELLLKRLNKKLQAMAMGLLCICIAVLVVFKYEVQADYANAWKSGRMVWQQMFNEVPALHAGEAVVVTIPTRPLGNLVDTGEAVGDLHLSAVRVYGLNALVFVSNYRQQIDSAHDQICFGTAIVANEFCEPRASVYFFTWNGKNLIPYGNSSSLKNRTVEQAGPRPMLKELTQ